MKTAVLCSVFCALVLPAFSYEEREHETIRQTFPSAQWLEVDNVFGAIHVTGYNGAEVQMTIEKTIEADSPSKLEEARREVKLNITQSGDRLKLCVEGPFRSRCRDGNNVNDAGRRGYRVIFDFELQVPAAMAVDLSTINNGKIELRNTSGDFKLANVNGGIEMEEVAGSGQAHTVNGAVKALFASNPLKDCDFKSVNGGLEASFRRNLSADIHVKTFNGDAFTDFEATALPVTASAEQRGGKFIYRSNRSSAFRIGSGGPALKFDTLNGSIRIVNREQ